MTTRRAALWSGLLLSTLAGCASSDRCRGQRIRAEADGPEARACRRDESAFRTAARSSPRPRVANLALGPSVWHNRIAENYNDRSSWPSIDRGYEYDSVTTFTEFIYDNQAFYDDRAGGYSRDAQTLRTTTIVR